MFGTKKERTVYKGILVFFTTALIVLGIGTWAWQRYHYRPVSTGGQQENAVEAPSSDPVVLAAGDIATCGVKGSEETAAILGRTEGMILALGDEAYPSGSVQEFKECYGTTWGAHRSRTRPVPGNHEYRTPNASAYFEYFGTSAGDPTKGYYSYDIGTWHVVALNTNCSDIGGCGEDSPEARWLQADLASNGSICTLAYMHVPRFSSGTHGSDTAMQTFWRLMAENGVDVVLTGHDHLYERFAPMDANGTKDEQKGIREFIVGTGGGNVLYNFNNILPTSEARNNTTFGALKLILHPAGYEWDFIPVAGSEFRDMGRGTCH
ncbi:MAG: metallophosphoesterase [Candidatus Kerfeldbacteria bacterium]